MFGWATITLGIGPHSSCDLIHRCIFFSFFLAAYSQAGILGDAGADAEWLERGAGVGKSTPPTE